MFPEISATWLMPLLTLSMLEIVLGVDNLVFLSIVTGRLPEQQRASARRYGLAFACITRILFLLTISWLADMTQPVFVLLSQGFSIKDLVLIAGGLFLLVKATLEIHAQVETAGSDGDVREAGSYWMSILQIALIDIVFSIDTVVTAVGMSNNRAIMVSAILLSVAVMMLASNPIGNFIERHPTIKMLALAFLILVGVALVADGFEFHIPRQYLYFAMAFSASVEALNMLARRASAQKIDGE
jgi:predicted tellurium resistance membrane protein TerC